MGADPADNGLESFAHVDLTREVIRVFFDVCHELGFGFLESVDREAMYRALIDAGLTVRREVPVEVVFRDVVIAGFRIDLLVEEHVIVELKSVPSLASAHRDQLINYLRSTRYELGLLLNFGLRPEIRRVVFSNHRTHQRRPPF